MFKDVVDCCAGIEKAILYFLEVIKSRLADKNILT